MAQTILVIEDVPEDFEALQRAFRAADPNQQLLQATTAQEALRFLKEPPRLPIALVILDLKLPGDDGHSFIATMKNDANLKQVPLVVLSGSSDPDDVQKSYACGAAGYFMKPIDRPMFDHMVRVIYEYWMKHACLIS